MTALRWLHLWTSIAAIAIFATRAIQASSVPKQVPFIAEHAGEVFAGDYADGWTTDRPDELPRSPIDVLTSSPQHTLFVRLLQRARLFPSLIRLVEHGDGRGLTILAPTNEAIHASPNALLLAALDSGPLDAQDVDNIGAQLRQHLLHHIVNYTLPYDVIVNDSRRASQAREHVASLDVPIERPHMHVSLHRPSARSPDEPTRPGPIPQPPDEPWYPGEEDESDLLGGEGQKIRTLWKWSSPGKAAEGLKGGKTPKSPQGALWFGVDSQGKDGVASLEDRWTQRGLVIFVNGTLPLPPTLRDVVRGHPSLEVLSSIMDDGLLHSLTHAAHTTFFLPKSSAFESLTTLQRSYLLRNSTNEDDPASGWSALAWDRVKLAGWHVTSRGLQEADGQMGRIAYTERIRDVLNDNSTLSLTTILGGPLHLRYADSQNTSSVAAGSPREILLGGKTLARIVEEDILTENGVIHIVDGLLPPSQGALELNVEKTLLALNASRFVAMMRKADLEDYLQVGGLTEDDTDARSASEDASTWTFAVPSDDVLEKWLSANPSIERWWRQIEIGANDKLADHDEPDAKTKLGQVLKYHIFPQLVRPNDIQDGQLISTELRDWRLKEGRQRIMTTKRSGGAILEHNDHLAFGDANVLSPPVIVNAYQRNESEGDAKPVPVAAIYIISQLLSPPEDPIQTAVSASLDLSTFVAAIFSSQLEDPLRRAPGVTYLVPNNEAFNNLGGLIMRYLLLNTDESRGSLRRVVEYHSIDEIVYVQDIVGNDRPYPTLEGSKIWVNRSEEDHKIMTVRRSSGTDADGNPVVEKGFVLPAHILSRDLLTNTGVLHEIDRVEIPPDLDLTNEKLLRGAKCDTFRDLVMRAGYGFVLNGSLPAVADDVSTLSRRKKKRKGRKRRGSFPADPDRSYVLLAPTDEAFTRVDLAHYLARPDDLRKLVQLHIIPGPPSDDEDSWRRAEEQRRVSERGDGRSLTRRTHLALPLGLLDGWSVSSLLDRALGGGSRYGRLAFRETENDDGDDDEGYGDRSKGPGRDGRTPDMAWQVGILGTRGGSSPPSDTRDDGHSARILDFGRESRRVSSVKGRVPPPSLGGVLVISAVLQPYEPSWFYRWGWVALTVLLALAAALALGHTVWAYWLHQKRRAKRGGEDGMGEAMEGEEE
ncbi:unnamed protein product [Parajaminaea phylloscopi]